MHTFTVNTYAAALRRVIYSLRFIQNIDFVTESVNERNLNSQSNRISLKKIETIVISPEQKIARKNGIQQMESSPNTKTK